MKMISLRTLAFSLVLAVSATPVDAAGEPHPRLLLSPDDVALISETSPLPAGFDSALQAAKTDVDRYLDALPDVPVPKDAGGGYTHEQHKRNSVTIQNAGFLYQVTGNKAYAELARDILFAYAKLYPTLSEHPQQKGQSPGQLFWQSLKDCEYIIKL